MPTETTATTTRAAASCDSTSCEGGAGYGLLSVGTDDDRHKAFDKLRSEKIDFLRQRKNSGVHDVEPLGGLAWSDSNCHTHAAPVA